MKRILLMITVLITLISCNQAHKQEIKDDPVVAEWRGGRITLSEYEEFALVNRFWSELSLAVRSEMAERRDLLYGMIVLELSAQLADSLNLDTLEQIRDIRRRRFGTIAWSHFIFPDSIRRKAFPDSKIRQFYDDKKFEYRISHILISDQPTRSETFLSSLHDSLNTSPHKFPEFAKKYSADASTAVNGGDLGWALSVYFVPEFKSTIENLSLNEISKPFQTQFGWHIAMLNDKRQNPRLEPFARDSMNIVRELTQKYRKEYDKAFDSYRELLFDKIGITLFYDEIDKLTTEFNTLLSGDAEMSEGIKRFDRNTVLAKSPDGIFTIGDALDSFLGRADRVIVTELQHDDIARNIYLRYQTTYISDIADMLGYSDNPEVIERLNTAMKREYFDYFLMQKGIINDHAATVNWKRKLRKTYSASINHLDLEKSFYITPDNRK